MMGRYRVLHLSNDLDNWPECAEDSNEFPYLVESLESNYEMFILDESHGAVYGVLEFFDAYAEIREFSDAGHTQGLEDELQIATMYITAINAQILNARASDDSEAMHQAMISMIRDRPIISNNRIIVTAEQKTYLNLIRKAQ